MVSLAEHLETMYRRYNHRTCIPPDPLQFVYRYQDPRNREIVGLVASSLAYGQVRQIGNSVEQVLKVLGTSPSDFLMDASRSVLRRRLAGFKHRWTTGEEMADLLWGIARVESIEAAFASGLHGAGNVHDGLEALVKSLRAHGGNGKTSLLSSPAEGSACKRLHLYLRWMIRSDNVDPGIWSCMKPADLVIPLDTHMHRIGVALGFTTRRTGDRRTAEEITESFRRIAPHDPVRYDFALAKLGMAGHPEFAAWCRSAGDRRAA